MENRGENRGQEVLLSLEQRVLQQINRLESLLDQMEGINQQMHIAMPRAFKRKSEVRFFEFMHQVILQLKEENRLRTAEAYESAFASFRKFLKWNDIFLDEVTDELIRNYEMYLCHRGVSKNSSSFYMRILRAVINRAIDRDLMEVRNPFRHVYTGVDKTVKRALNLAAIKRIKNVNLSHNQACDFARDMFLFSFYMRGMSFIDMAHLKHTNLSRGYITYRRCKTGQELCIKWESCMQEIVDKHKDKCVGDYMLPLFNRNPQNRNQYKYSLVKLNKHLRDVAVYAHIYGTPLTLYVARHSWASIAKSKRIPLSVISECMGHDSEKTTRIYLASLDKSVIDRANRQILNDL